MTGESLGLGEFVNDKRTKAKLSKPMGKKVKQAVKRLKQKKNKTPAEVELLIQVEARGIVK